MNQVFVEEVRGVLLEIMALYKIKDIELGKAIDIFRKCLEASEKSQERYLKEISKLTFDFFRTNTEKKCGFVDWSKTYNNLLCTQKYMSLFANPVQGMWIAYSALEMLLAVTSTGKTGYFQIFYYKEREFWIIFDENRNRIMFITPEGI